MAKENLTESQVTVPPMLSETFSSLRDVVSGTRLPQPVDARTSMEHTVPIAVPVATNRVGNWIAVTNVQREVDKKIHEISVEDEVRECFEKLRGTFVPSATGRWQELRLLSSQNF